VWADAVSLPVLVAMMIGNFGAFLSGYGYGSPTELPWGITYSIETVKYTVPVHPTQIYAILLIGLLLMGFERARKKQEFLNAPGATALTLAWGYSGIHFLLEFIRGDDTLQLLGIRLPMILAGLAFLILGRQFLKLTHSQPKTS
jgi:phosphatidylglycerol:prolipoprotein diacylglycerol transferase